MDYLTIGVNGKNKSHLTTYKQFTFKRHVGFMKLMGLQCSGCI